jgi:hypothetical protein
MVVDAVDAVDVDAELLLELLVVLEQLNVALVPSNSTDWGEWARADLRETGISEVVAVLVLAEAVLKGLEHMVGDTDTILVVCC